MTVVECVGLPPFAVPVIVMVYVRLATPVVETFMVDEPDPVTELGENVGLGPAQLPLNCTVPLKPPLADTVTV